MFMGMGNESLVRFLSPDQDHGRHPHDDRRTDDLNIIQSGEQYRPLGSPPEYVAHQIACAAAADGDIQLVIPYQDGGIQQVSDFG